MNLCDIRTVRDILAAFGTQTKKNFGQNFLIRREIPERIAEECCDARDSVIVEIGPGIGCLTAELARRYRRVIAFEIDKTLIPVLKFTLGEFRNVEVIEGDIMEVDLQKVLAERAAGERISVCANLPYYITTPILMRLIESGVPFDSITVMVQAEVADRLTATPVRGDYGAITVAVRYYGQPRLLFPVGRDNFLPAPKVDSAVVRIDLYADKPVKPQSEKDFFKTVKATFGQRRKTLANALSAGLSDLGKDEINRAITDCGFDPQIRGEKLSVADFAALSDRLFRGK
ncbi:MAG: 16S rRNA (adenine(1518)-N(6)/adenine(1519)-N(6))-dimethyltransferase RsmA [Clostridia bacterium]|nr:16S rRNA (adenine(1518)-N(6)/adenine(1519)-N(6))-dimethyltransferase RsmA [Clostridia bacterium]